MSSGDQSKKGRSLRLERETLRDLAPSATDAAAVRGGDSSTCGGREYCIDAEKAFALLGRTAMDAPMAATSWGCRGVISIIETERGREIHFDLHPNEELQEMLPLLRKQLGG